MKNIYITWHYTTHGIAYLKHVLSSFYLKKELGDHIEINHQNQKELNYVFDNPIDNGFVFDKVIYLTAPQTTFDKLSSRRIAYKTTIFEDPEIINSGLTEVYKCIHQNEKVCYNIDLEIELIIKRFPDKLDAYKQTLWRNIQHYPIEQQFYWLDNFSNFQSVYKGKFDTIELPIDDLRDEEQISAEIYKFFIRQKKELEDANLIINVSLGSSETQVVWHILSESGNLPKQTRFIKTYDDKTDSPESRFKRFSIREVSTHLTTTIKTSFRLFEGTKSANRLLVDKKIEAFINTGFSILLIGERGIGKSQIARMAKERLRNENKALIPLIEANCASFEEDSKAEAELFGYEKGAFTGANKDKKGLLYEADNGILFLDEVHHLSKSVQAKLMKSLQTDRFNKMSIRPLGSNKEVKVECKLIFATNKTITELRECLLTDFYDRIVQHVIHIPALRETVEDREKDWKTVWKNLRFKKNPEPPKDSQLTNWLKQLPLYGNFRDLQKIAIYYNAFNQFDDETQKLLNEKSAFEYAKNEFDKYHSQSSEEPLGVFNFNDKKTTKEMIANYLYELQEWAVDKYNGRINAINHFKSLGESIDVKTLNNWKNKVRKN